MALTKSGEILKAARLKRGLTLESVEKETKMRVKFLRALEEGNLSTFHSLPYARGFLKNYSEFLGLDSALILALFRRETAGQIAQILPSGLVKEEPFFSVTPKRAMLLVAALIAASIIYYLFQEYRGFLGAPALTVERPQEEQVLSEGTIEVKGKADSDATILVNGEPVVLGKEGNFTKVIRIFKGEETIIVIAKNRRGKETTVRRQIKVE